MRMQRTEQTAPDGHLRGAVRGGARAERQNRDHVRGGIFPFVVFGQQRQIGRRRFQRGSRGAVALAVEPVAGGAVFLVHLVPGRSRSGLDGHFFDHFLGSFFRSLRTGPRGQRGEQQERQSQQSIAFHHAPHGVLSPRSAVAGTIFANGISLKLDTEQAQASVTGITSAGCGRSSGEKRFARRDA